MINILIVEDTALHFEIIADAITADLGHLVKLYPKNILDKERNFNDLNFLIESLQAEKFQEVIDFYKDIDMFIIDATLTPKSDTLGIKFLKFIQKKYSQNFKAIVISNTEELGQLVDTRQFPFISKIKHGIHDNFSIVLSNTVKHQFQIGRPDTADDTPLLQHFKKYIKVYGWKFAFHSLWILVTKNIQRHIIDKLVLLLFYLLMIVTIIYGGYNVLHSIYEAFQNLKDDTMILKVAEHIFLNLLPMFIVFGFFHYYKTNIRVFLLEGNTYSVDDEFSTKTMNLTKILFISSIISYVLIKIIEEVFIHGTNDIVRLISFGALLLILMGYFIFLDKKKH